jgi:hypothetical protein
MDKSLTVYYNSTKKAIDNLEEKSSRVDAKVLYRYHIERVRDFQHERLIHLLVTLFFSGLLIVSVVGILWISSITIDSAIALLVLFTAIAVILFVTVLFYIRHYYRLENGVQKLYTLTERLQEKLDKD